MDAAAVKKLIIIRKALDRIGYFLSHFRNCLMGFRVFSAKPKKTIKVQPQKHNI
jgi:hypothetical protein